jgi:hypothetical protein
VSYRGPRVAGGGACGTSFDLMPMNRSHTGPWLPGIRSHIWGLIPGSMSATRPAASGSAALHVPMVSRSGRSRCRSGLWWSGCSAQCRFLRATTVSSPPGRVHVRREPSSGAGWSNAPALTCLRIRWPGFSLYVCHPQVARARRKNSFSNRRDHERTCFTNVYLTSCPAQ